MPQPLRLIIVDDESFMRDNLAHLFPWEELGYEVASVFANGREALAYLEHNPADVVLTDIQMPVMDGLELALSLIHIYTINKLVKTSAPDSATLFNITPKEM